MTEVIVQARALSLVSPLNPARLVKNRRWNTALGSLYLTLTLFAVRPAVRRQRTVAYDALPALMTYAAVPAGRRVASLVGT